MGARDERILMWLVGIVLFLMLVAPIGGASLIEAAAWVLAR